MSLCQTGLDRAGQVTGIKDKKEWGFIWETDNLKRLISIIIKALEFIVAEK